MNNIGKCLREARIAAGLSQEALAERLGKTRPFISQVERGKGTTTESLLQWADALGLVVTLVPRGHPGTAGISQPSAEERAQVMSEDDLASALRALREAAGLSRPELAKVVGVTPSAIANIELAYSATTTRLLIAWLKECGATLNIERGALSPGQRAPGASGFAPTDPLVLQLHSMLPRLSARDRKMIEHQLRFIARDDRKM